MSLYDTWRCIDQLADQQAEYDAKFAALAAQIRTGLRIGDYLTEIEVDASFDEKVCQSITQAFLNGVDCGAIMHAYANDWLDRHSERLALARIQGLEL
jgi:hypothetical protein